MGRALRMLVYVGISLTVAGWLLQVFVLSKLAH